MVIEMSVRSYSVTALPVMLVLLSLTFSFLNIQNFLALAIRLISTCFIPGFLLLKRLRIQLEFYELVLLSIVFSMAISIFLGFYLSITSFHITPFSVLSSILFFTITLQLYSHFFERVDSKTTEEQCKGFLEKLKEKKVLLFLLIIVGLIPIFLLLDDVLRYEYYLGYDPYSNEPLILSIIQNKLDPNSLLSQEKIVFSGFYYFGAVLHVSTGISIHNFTRFGGLAFFSLLLMILFIDMYQIFNDKWVAIIPFFFAVNPFVVNRFLMTIRENLSFLFLAVLIFFLLKLDKNNKKSVTIISAMTFGAILSTNPLTLIFASVFVFFFILTKHDVRTYVLLIFGGCLFVFPMLGIFASWLSWVTIAQFQIFLGYSRIPAPPWLSEQEVLSAWGRDMSFGDFSILEIALLPLGIFYAVKKRYILKTKKLFFIIPFCLSALTLYVLAKIGFHFTPARLVIYVAIPLAILSGLGLKEVITKISEYMPTLVIITSTRRKVLTKKTFKKIFVTAVVIPIIFFNSMTIISSNKWCPYVSSQVEAAKWLKQYIGDRTDTIVIPSHGCGYSDMGLIEHVGIKNAIFWANQTLVKDIMSAPSFEELREIIRINYPDKNEAYFFISKRWITTYEREYNFTILNILESINMNDGCVEKIFDQDVLIYKIDLHRSVITLKSDDDEIDKWVGISFNDRKAMKILFLENGLNINSVVLSMYLKKRDFNESGAYEGNWSVIVNNYTHTYSWNDIPEEGGWIKKEIPTCEILEGENQIIIFKQSPDHIFIGLDTDNDFNNSAFYCEKKWDYDKLGKWYGTFNGEYMIRLVITVND